MKFLLVPDSFKGSLDADKFCELIINQLSKDEKNTVKYFPAFDGGDNFSNIISKITGATIITSKYTDGNFTKKVATFGIKKRTAYIGVSNTSGLPDTEIKDPKLTTTLGMGEQILDAINAGCNDIVIGLGGSSTNDAGCGMLVALGAKFYDKEANEFIPTGCNLGDIVAVDLKQLNKNIKDVSFTILCDVENPLVGPKGCSKTFAKQKGASDEDIELLEDNMKKFLQFCTILFENPDSQGCGAAGGLGFAFKNFLKGTLISGAEFFLKLIDFENISKDIDYVITGEGKFDNTSLGGKICGTIISKSLEKNIKVAVFCGKAGLVDKIPVNTKVYSLYDDTLSFDENIKLTEKHLIEKFNEFRKTL
ncbi:MAG: glycerate kinase [Clostridia bacterium]|nr:glycerate kinase [Clostridia bacterium]